MTKLDDLRALAERGILPPSDADYFNHAGGKVLRKLLSEGGAEQMAREYERRIFKHEWEDDDGWTAAHSADAIQAMRAAINALIEASDV